MFYISVVFILRWILVSSFIRFYLESLPRSGMHISSLPRQNDMFITTLKQTVMQIFLDLFYLMISKINWYLLTGARNAAYKNSNF